MNLFLDTSALVKRYVEEEGSEIVEQMMAMAERWFVCEVTFVETVRAVELVTGNPAIAFEREWSKFDVIPIDHQLSIQAARIATTHQLRTLDALQLAAATLVQDELFVATWDRRLLEACERIGLKLDPLTPLQ